MMILHHCKFNNYFNYTISNNKKFRFPSMPGDPVSYLPLELTPVASQQLYNGTGYGTIYEMILGYDTKSCVS